MPTKITFKGSDVRKVALASKKKMRLVHDDGTYLIPDIATRPLVRPTSGEIPAGHGDDFVEYIPIKRERTILSLAKMVVTLVSQNEMTIEWQHKRA